MAEDKKEKKQKNKGITVNPAEVVKDNRYFSDTDSSIQSLGATKSISRVKNELQTVIDLMGPTTPQFLQSPSNDGDNELSATSETTKKSWDENKSEEPSEAASRDTTDKTVPPDITLQEDTDISVVADKNSSTFEFREFPRYMCPPPLIPANILYNSECICPQMASYIHNGGASMQYLGAPQMEEKKLDRQKNLFYKFFRNLASNLTTKNNGYVPGKCEYYTMNIKESRNENSPPRRLVFELVGDVARHGGYKLDDFTEPYVNQTLKFSKAKDLKNFNNEQLTKEAQQSEALPACRESVQFFDKSSRKFNQTDIYADNNGATRVDVYYFDRGDSNYLKTTDSPPVVLTENLAERTEAYTTRFWAEIFGTLHIGVSFGISFVLQLFRFFLYSLFRPLTVGLVQLGTDYFLKPCIATLFNAIVQPPLIFLYNVCASLRDVCRPIAEGMGYFLKETATAIKAFRIIDIRREKISDRVSNTEKDKVEEKTEKTELVA
ncbi:uncharacterized protein LOC108911062 [Anoplophora glabripennis]|uniref:uncharacterized protein LOC108911062 n=1 Tax=Anoplophora glabripennis TaxID=217634 RepID=UPI00087521E1|nr:uncharacterized protein LOC108911062 [Anoplophora glabripennis]